MASTKNLNNWLDECRCLLGTIEEKTLKEAVDADVAEALKPSHNSDYAKCADDILRLELADEIINKHGCLVAILKRHFA